MAKKKLVSLELGNKGTWEGIVKKVMYLGQKNYAVIKVDIDGCGEITAEGTIPSPRDNSRIQLTGTVVHNEKYNDNQIHVTSAVTQSTPQEVAAIKFLCSDAIKGIGIKAADSLIAMYGADLNSFMTDANKLKAAGIAATRIPGIITSYVESKMLYKLFELTNGDITLHQAEKIYSFYKDKTATVINTNPYQLIYDIDGFGFLTADALALKLGFKYDSDERIFAALTYCLESEKTSNGHCFLPIKLIKEMVADLVFSNKELKNIYFQDVLGLTGIPDDLSEWEDLNLSELSLVKHKTKIANIIAKWDRPEEKAHIIKKEKFTSDEVDCIDIYFTKKQEILKHINNVLVSESFDATGMTSKSACEELALSKNAGYRLVIYRNTLNETLVYSRQMFLTECRIAKTLAELTKSAPIRLVSTINVDNVIGDIEAEELKKIQDAEALKPVEERKTITNYSLDNDQKQAVKMALNNRVSVISGGPGRGKTTIIRTAVKAWLEKSVKVPFSKLEPQAILLAPTGKAAKRMTESTGYPAMTIHRFLLHIKDVGILNDDTIIFVDESSMLDIFLMDRLLRNVQRAQICFVGDIDQLESVGPGAVLSDMIKSKSIPCTYLTHCHRNAGSILYNSTVINDVHQLRDLIIDNHFKTYWIPDKVKLNDNLVNFYCSKAKSFGVDNTIILTAMRENVNKLNVTIQNKVNPEDFSKPQVESGTIKVGNTVIPQIYRLGDRVIQDVNDYNRVVEVNGIEDTGVFNGETGTITDINFKNPKDKVITVTFDDGKKGFYSEKDIKTTSLAYALTYHKSQGSEYKCVICSLTTGDYILLKRKILYTGESRAKEFCMLVGDAKAFSMAMNNVTTQDRNTTLSDRINQFLI